MIRDLRLSKNRAVCSYLDNNSRRQFVSWASLRDIFEYALPSQIEYLNVHISNDGKYLIILMSLYSDQCAHLFLWDTINRTIVWERDTPYVSACEVLDKKVYVAYSVHNYMTRPFTYIESIDIHTGAVKEYDNRFPSPIDRDAVKICADQNEVCLLINDERFIVDNT